MPLVFAYGSNLNVSRMKGRCPSARVVGRAYLENYSLLFENNGRGRVVANITKDDGDFVDGVLYEVSGADLYVLDGYEGHPYVYKRTLVSVRCKGGRQQCWVYIMLTPAVQVWDKLRECWRYVRLKHRAETPQGDYLQHIEIGYKLFGFDKRRLRMAAERRDI